MRKYLAALTFIALATPANADNYVQGYFKSDGTYVQPHYQTNPNSTTLDNYSTRGNVNPYTGRAGTVDPYKTTPSYGVNNLNRRRF